MLAAVGCQGPAPPVSAHRAPGALEDAVSRVYGEDEVDVAARPASPIRPTYPPRLRALGVEGDVEARVVVRADGSAGGAELVESSHDAFTAAAREALRTARFHPARLQGVPVSSWVTVRLQFRLER